jgi:hypothetical protein
MSAPEFEPPEDHDPLADGERLLVALVDVALNGGAEPLRNALGALDFRDTRLIVLVQALTLAEGIREARAAPPPGRLARWRRAWRAAVAAWREEAGR